MPREAIVMKNQRATRQAQLPSEGEIGKLFLSLEDPEFGGPQPPLKTAISKFVMILLRHCDQEERDSDGATQ